MIIAPAKHKDLHGLAALARKTYAAAFGHSFSKTDLAAHLSGTLSDAYFHEAIEADEFLVAQHDDTLIGFVQFGSITSDVPGTTPADQELRRLYVLTDFQSRGVGRALMDTALAHPRLQFAPAIYLDVWERNDGARRLYERYGFEVVGAKPLLVASGVARDRDLIMVRRSKPEAKR